MESIQRSMYLYRGHRIHLETEMLAAGRWVWRYRVEGRNALDGQGSAVLGSASEALDAALEAATEAVEAAYRPYASSDWGPLRR